MSNLVSLLATLALVSMQFVDAQIENKLDIDNSLGADIPDPLPKRRSLRNKVRITGSPPETLKHVVGTRLELTCEVLGHPAPTVQWLKNGEAIDFEEETNNILTVHPSSYAQVLSTLVLSAGSENAEDVYTCLAVADLKKDAASTTVYTVQKPGSEDLLSFHKLFSKPKIVTYYGDLMQDQDTSVVLPCRVHSFSKYQIFWTDNSGRRVYGNSRIRMLQSGDLLISNLMFTDVGDYNCTVKNAFGKDSVTTFVYPLLPEEKGLH